MFQHILLPTDGSEAALRAVRRGVELAARLGAEVTVMTVVEHFPAGIMASGYRPESELPEATSHDPGEERLQQAETLARAAGVTCHRLLVRDQPVYRAIIDAARDCGADLIVMGTRGMGLLERMFIGSQTQRVLTHTEIPVLTFH